jgi:hypothetical protein
MSQQYDPSVDLRRSMMDSRPSVVCWITGLDHHEKEMALNSLRFFTAGA